MHVASEPTNSSEFLSGRSMPENRLASDLHGALERNELQMYYQPIVGLHSGRIEGFEALLRWKHPIHGLVQPDNFIPFAEQTGLIVAIGRWVLRRACADATTWPENLYVSVNLSVVQFTPSRELVSTVTEALTYTGLAAHRLELEITETLPLAATENNFAILRQLREQGLRIALDDFGTGHATLGFLRRFTFDRIKLDRCLVPPADGSDDTRCTAILVAVADLAATLGLRTTAEGVENARQLALLRAYPFDQVQGYHFSPPIRPDQIAPLLAAH